MLSQAWGSVLLPTCTDFLGHGTEQIRFTRHYVRQVCNYRSKIHVTVSRKLAFHNVSKKTYTWMLTQDRSNEFLFSIHNKAQSFRFSSFHYKVILHYTSKTGGIIRIIKVLSGRLASPHLRSTADLNSTFTWSHLEGIRQSSECNSVCNWKQLLPPSKNKWCEFV
jgi:hypothetical protein